MVRAFHEVTKMSVSKRAALILPPKDIRTYQLQPVFRQLHVFILVDFHFLAELYFPLTPVEIHILPFYLNLYHAFCPAFKFQCSNH